VTKMYTPAAASSAQVSAGTAAEELAAWKRKVRNAWPQVAFTHVEQHFNDSVTVGLPVQFGTLVRLGELQPGDVDVQLLVGDVDDSDELHNLRIYSLSADGSCNEWGETRFSATVPATFPGSVGWTLRIVPWNRQLATPAEMGLATIPPDDIH
jgi:starch phosphorylase